MGRHAAALLRALEHGGRALNGPRNALRLAGVLLLALPLACRDTAAPHDPGATAEPTPRPDRGEILLAAGDIGECGSASAEATAALLDGVDGTVAVLGDNAYERGSVAEYADCYGPTWGRHKARTRPAIGNHEYGTAGAAGHWDYWGDAAGPPGQGYYSYELGAWHVVVLNSNCSIVSCAAGSPQERWLRTDLASHPAACTLAYFHHPRFSSGARHGGTPRVQPLWQALYEAGAEVVLAGHEHIYERFTPQTPAGRADEARGIRQFTVGTGGRALSGFGMLVPNSELRDSSTFGVLRLTLGTSSYGWEFLPVPGGALRDAGAGACH